MLVLTLKLDEVLQIGSEIRVRVLGIERGRVKLGTDAPRALEIRHEDSQANGVAAGEAAHA